MMEDTNMETEYSDDIGEYLDASMETLDSSLEMDENVDSKPEWLEDETVPPGYKRRLIDNDAMVHSWIRTVQAPDGKEFRSRQGALRVLIKKNAPEHEIEQMRSCLIYEDWESHKLLPTENWRLRKQKKEEHRTKINLMSDKGEFFMSYKDASRYVETNYDSDTLKRMNSLMDILGVEMRMEGYDWSESDSVPQGWKVRIAEGKTGKEFFLSPDGKMFPSRIVAVQHMIREQFNQDDIDLMKLKLIEHEDWFHHGKLPSDWLIKENRQNKYHVNFLTRQGDVIESFSQAFDYIQLNEGYSDLDTQLLLQLSNEKSNERRKDIYEWEERKSLPPGWRVRSHTGKRDMEYILSPNGEQFPNRRLAILFMFEKNYPKEEIEIMRLSMQEEGWKGDKMLPNDKWIYSRSSDKHQVVFITEDGKYFKAAKHALKHIESCYEQKIVDNFKSFLDLQTIVKRTMGYNWNSSDITVPAGWMTRQVDRKRKKTFILSPEGVQFHNRRQALVSMIKNGADKDDIDEMRAMLRWEGFEKSPLLPKNWLYCDLSQSSFAILTEDGEVFDSFSRCLQYMREGQFSSKQISNMEDFEKEKLQFRRANHSEWEENSDLPSGWKSKPGNGRLMFLSPEGVTHYNRRTCLQMMLQSKMQYSAEDIQKMRDQLQLEHWEPHPLLPRGWLVRTIKSVTQGRVITSDGEVIESQVAVKEYMQNNTSRFSSTDIENLAKVFDDVNKKIRLAEAANEVDKSNTTLKDSNMPGWTLKYKGEKLLSLTSPSGVKCDTRLEALQLMAKEDYPFQNVKHLLASLKIEGWKFSRMLPEYWMYRSKRRRGENVVGVNFEFLSSRGEVFRTIEETLEHINTWPTLSSFDSSAMVKYFSNLQGRSKTSNEQWEEDARLPNGFRFRLHSGKVEKLFYLTRDGTQFASLKLLLMHMLKENYDDEDIGKVKDLLFDEGYEENQHLPANWVWKFLRSGPDKGPVISIISNKGVEFHSFHSAIEMINLSSDHTEADVDNLKKLQNEKIQHKRQSMEGWEESDTLPAGWRWKRPYKTSNRTFYLSPEGNQFHSRRLALVHMISNKYPRAVIEFMRGTLGQEGFEENDLLPSKWLIRYRHKESTNDQYGNLAICIVTDFGLVLESFGAAVEIMKNNPKKYSQQDIDNIGKYAEMKRNDRRKSSDNSNWRHDSELPKGWRFKSTTGGAGDSRYFFLSPDGQMVKGRKQLYSHFLSQNDMKSATTVRKLLIKYEDWNENQLLPTGWILRERVVGQDKEGHSHRSYHFITREGVHLEGTKNSLDHIRTSPGYTAQELENFAQLVSSLGRQRHQPGNTKAGIKAEVKVKSEPKVKKAEMRAKVKTESSERAWCEDPSVPSDWRTRAGREDGGKSFQSPDGQIFQTRRTALVHLLATGGREEDVRKLRAGLRAEGWKQSTLLPPDWWFKLNEEKKQQISIISGSDGSLLRSMKAAEDFIKEVHPEYSEKFQQFSVITSKLFKKK